MANEDGCWVFESLVGLLRGPVWNIPILTFIEQKSLIFEPDCEDNEEYAKTHEDYKNLVDFMLGSYMEDLGITPEQFEEACGQASKNVKSQFHHSLFEQVWAAEDYEIFKRMMIQKNIELQLQALELLQQRYGIMPESMTFGTDISQEEEAVMEEVLKKSMEEHQNVIDKMDQDTKDLEKNMAMTQEEKTRLESEMHREKELLDKAMKMSLKDDGSKDAEPEPEPEPPVAYSLVHTTMDSAEKFCLYELGKEVEPPPKADPEEIARRQAHLRQQRDKLLSLKKQEREKQLQQLEKNNPQKRPSSARAAQAVLDSQQPGSNIDPKTLAARQALVARLKAEVIGAQ